MFVLNKFRSKNKPQIFYSFFLPSCFLSLLPPFLATFNIFFHSHYLCFLDISSFLPSWLVYYILLPCFLSHHSFLPSFLPSVCPVSFIIPSLHYVPFCHKFPLPSFLLPSVLICYIVLTFLYILYTLSFPPSLFPLFVFLPSLIDSSNIPSSLPSVLVSFTVLSVCRSAHTSLFCLPSFCPYCLHLSCFFIYPPYSFILVFLPCLLPYFLLPRFLCFVFLPSFLQSVSIFPPHTVCVDVVSPHQSSRLVYLLLVVTFRRCMFYHLGCRFVLFLIPWKWK